MEMPRREFLQLSLAQAVLLGVPHPAASQENFLVLRQTGPSVLQGATDETSTQFSVVFDSQIDLDLYVTDSNGRKWLADEIQPIQFKNHSHKITKAYFSGLPAGELLNLHIANQINGTILDQREFKTLVPNPNRPLKFTICSCMNEFQHSAEIWRTMVAKEPDVIFFIGDSVYADIGAPRGGADPAHLWHRFVEARRTLDIYYSKRLIPLLATWDDHDFGLNDAGLFNYRFVNESQQNFLNFFAQDPRYCRFMKKGPGISSSYLMAGQLFVLMDDRSFRLEKGSLSRWAHWGQPQEEWLLSQVGEHSGPTWLMNGSQIFPSLPFKESFSSDHPQQFEGMLKQLNIRSSKVIFVSGDVHYTEITQVNTKELGYQTYELTSSSIHSKNLIPGSPHVIPNPHRIAGNGARNYILVETQMRGPGADFAATSFEANGLSRFRLKLSV